MWQSSYINTLNKNIMIVQVKKIHGKKSNIKVTWSSQIQLSYRKESMCLGHLLPECVASVPNRTTKLVLSTKPTRHVHKRLFCFTRLPHALGGLFSKCAKVYWSQSVAFYRCTWSYDAWLVHLYCTDDRLMSVWMKIMAQAEKMAAVVHSLWHYALKSQVWLPALVATFCLWWKATMLMHHAFGTCCAC